MQDFLNKATVDLVLLVTLELFEDKSPVMKNMLCICYN